MSIIQLCGIIQHICSDAVLHRVSIIHGRHYAFPRALNITVSYLRARHPDLNRVILDRNIMTSEILMVLDELCEWKTSIRDVDDLT